MLTSEQFVDQLRGALNHLYDPDHLRKSPLATLFGLADRFDTPYNLQRTLIEAIEGMEPEAGDSHQSPARQNYELLFYRYVQQFSQREVADQLGMSVRHLRRKQHAALEALAYRLWERFGLDSRIGDEKKGEASPEPATGPSVSEELAWLKDAPPESSAELDEVLPAVLDLVRPLAAQHGTRLEVTVSDDVPAVAVHPVALRQALLSLLSVAVRQAAGRRVEISVRSQPWDVEIRVQGPGFSGGSSRVSGDNATSLDMARRLTEICRGGLAISSQRGSFEATVTLPALEKLPILVIEDNADTLQLLQRYASGTRYRVIGTQDPEQALDLAKTFSPQVIVLDVMMPDVDGWEVLGRLGQHPATSGTPTIVCTILAQEDLALALGAGAFIRKPVSRQDFLTALDRQIARKEPESR